jgi:hypothetical protein
MLDQMANQELKVVQALLGSQELQVFLVHPVYLV